MFAQLPAHLRFISGPPSKNESNTLPVGPKRSDCPVYKIIEIHVKSDANGIFSTFRKFNDWLPVGYFIYLAVAPSSTLQICRIVKVEQVLNAIDLFIISFVGRNGIRRNHNNDTNKIISVSIQGL